MKNAMTQKQYVSIKRERYTFFAFKDGKRLMTYAGLSMLEAMQQQARFQAPDQVTLIVHDSHVRSHGTAYNIEAFQYLFDLKGKALTPKGVE